MKKKIKDLTLGQVRKLCKNTACQNCALYIDGKYLCNTGTLTFDDYAEDEVEIDE